MDYNLKMTVLLVFYVFVLSAKYLDRHRHDINGVESKLYFLFLNICDKAALSLYMTVKKGYLLFKLQRITSNLF